MPVEVGGDLRNETAATKAAPDKNSPQGTGTGAIRYQPAVLRWRNTISTIRKRACRERADPVRSRRSHQEPRSRKLKHICMRVCMHVYALCNVHYLLISLGRPVDKTSRGTRVLPALPRIVCTTWTWFRSAFSNVISSGYVIAADCERAKAKTPCA